MRSALVLFAALLIACGSPLPAAKLPALQVIDSAVTSADLSASEDEVSMEIVELMCNPCAAQIVSKSRLVPGVTKVSMVLATKTLVVRYDSGLIGRDSVIASVEQIVASIQ